MAVAGRIAEFRQERDMGRISAGMWCSAILVSLAGTAESQSYEPRGRTFSQGGGWRHAPREHHVQVRVPSWYGYPDYGYGGYGFVMGGPGLAIGFGSPGVFYGGYPGLTYGAITYPGAYLPYPVPMSQMPGSPLQAPPEALPAQQNPWNNDLPQRKIDPVLRPVVTSPAASRLRALELQAEGDQNVRIQNWQRAYINYRQAVAVADDLPEAHLRYGIVMAEMNRFDQAANEFRRAVHVDPELPTSQFTLEKLFGPDSKLARGALISRTTAWAEENPSDPNRLFVLAVLLHFDGNSRAQELFSSIVQMTDGAQHAVVFLPRAQEDQPANPIPPRPEENGQLPEAPLPPAPQPDANQPRKVPPPPKPMLNDATIFGPRSKVAPSAIAPKADGPVLLPPTPE